MARKRNKGGRKSGRPITLARRLPTTLPDHWRPSSDDRKSAAACGFTENEIEIELARFKEACAGHESDSWSKAWREWCKGVRGRKIILSPSGGTQHVNVNRRESLLEYWLGRGLIDHPQYEAGSDFRADWEKVILGGGRGHDYSRPFVDGNPPRDPLRDSQLEASNRLKKIALSIGRHNFSILVHVLGQRLTIVETAAAFGFHQKWDQDRFGIMAREALAMLTTLK